VSTAYIKSRTRKRKQHSPQRYVKADHQQSLLVSEVETIPKIGMIPQQTVPIEKREAVIPYRQALSNLSEYRWRVVSTIILSLAALIRIYNLPLKPLHHDEGVNGSFLITLARSGFYKYNPENYHGPTLYYLTLPFNLLFGLNTYSMRLVTVIFGLITVWLMLSLRSFIGSIGALVAASLIALSPGAVYFSRYYIHEMLFVCFTLGIVIGAMWYYKRRKSLYLYLASTSAALLFATKETAFIPVGVIILSIVCVELYPWFRKQMGWKTTQYRETYKDILESIRSQNDQKQLNNLLVTTVGVFIVVGVLFYSSFFSNTQGLSDAINALAIWTKTGTVSHVYPWHIYLKWLSRAETTLLILGGIGVVFALKRAETRFIVFVAAWTIGIITSHMLIPYKTPWLALSFLVPLAIAGGYAVEIAIRRWGMGVALMLTGVMLLLSLSQSLSLNFHNYDNNDGTRFPYVYAHTDRQFVVLVNEIEKAATKINGYDTNISIASTEYWPMPWYMRNYKNVGYAIGNNIPDNADIIVCSKAQEAELSGILNNSFQKVGSYVLRPGVDLLLYVRKQN
jgi:uncharacterized protein (TIGR03663 family)